MPCLTLSTQGIVLLKHPPKERFQPLTLFSAEHGHLALWQRMPKRNEGGAGGGASRSGGGNRESSNGGTVKAERRSSGAAGKVIGLLDLFDEAEILAESPNQGQSWFIKEARLLHRPSGIARSYDTLRHACDFAATLAKNRVPAEVRPGVMELLRRALAAFTTHDRADLIHLKALYSFARDEGYPLRQHWLPTLSGERRALAQTLLARPLSEQNPPPETVAQLHRHLCDYLHHHTEILVS